MRFLLPIFCAVWLVWNGNNPLEEVTYNVYSASEVVGPWTMVVNVSTNAWQVTPVGQRRFYKVTATNHWGESGFSNITNTAAPALPVTGLKVDR